MVRLGFYSVLGVTQYTAQPGIDLVLGKSVKRGLEVIQNDCVGESVSEVWSAIRASRNYPVELTT